MNINWASCADAAATPGRLSARRSRDRRLGNSRDFVEPGSARTDFRYGGAKLGTWMEAYAGTPIAHVHRMMKEATSVPIGDPSKMAAQMIGSVDQIPAPKRLAFGSDAYMVMHKMLSARLADLESQRELAFSTDAVVARAESLIRLKAWSAE